MILGGWGAGGWLPHPLCPTSAVWAGPSLSAGSQASPALLPRGIPAHPEDWYLLFTKVALIKK